MKGRLAPDYTPYVKLEVIEADDAHELVVDTGFNDCLYLPEDTIARWNLPFVISTTASLADGRAMIADLYEARVIWFGVTVRVPVLAGPSGCDSLVGMGLLAGCRIELDERNGEIRVSKL